jgi:hypothetical protein
MSSAQESLISRLQQQIARAVRVGVELDEIEQLVIEPAPIDEDEQAALWLYAQALIERREESAPSARPVAARRR